LRLCLERLALAPTPSVEELKARLAQPLSLCQQAEEEVDKLIFDLRPALLDDLGLVEAVKLYAETLRNGTPVLTGTIRQLAGFKAMPPSTRLDECSIRKVELWIQQGISNN